MNESAGAEDERASGLCVGRKLGARAQSGGPSGAARLLVCCSAVCWPLLRADWPHCTETTARCREAANLQQRAVRVKSTITFLHSAAQKFVTLLLADSAHGPARMGQNWPISVSLYGGQISQIPPKFGGTLFPSQRPLAKLLRATSSPLALVH